MASIASTLGIGSGVDTKALVASLVAASSEPKTIAIKAQTSKITSQISGISQLKSGLTNFSTSLQTLIAGGSLSTQPTTSDSGIVTAKLVSGAKLANISSTILVKQLSTQQIASGPGFASADAPVGTGTLTFQFGTATTSSTTANGVTTTAMDGFTPGSAGSFAVTIDSSNNSLAGLARAINDKKMGISASIVNDGAQSRLVIKGPNGASQAFTMEASGITGSPSLAAFDLKPGSTGTMLQQAAQDSISVVDGITVTRASNTLSGVIDGITLDLVKASPGTTVSIGATRPTDAISTAVNDFVAAYNELQTILGEQADPKTGVLSGDAAVRQMRSKLGSLTSTPLRAEGTPRTLAEIGVYTNRDGTLAVDASRLSKALANAPDEVEAMFNPAQSVSSPLIKITSASGALAAGSYELTDIIAAKPGSYSAGAVADLFGADGATPIVLGSEYKINVAVDGKDPVLVTVPSGSYADGAALAAAVSDAIKANALISGVIAVKWDGDRLVASSALLGKSSAVSIGAENSGQLPDLGFETGVAMGGSDASGMIGGKPADASGSRLFAAIGTLAYGLIIQPTGDVPTGKITVDLGLSAALSAVSKALTSTEGGLYTANTRLEKQASQLAEQQTKVNDAATALETRLTKQFASMDSRVAVYKQTQAFLTQQVDAWNASDN